MLQLVILMSDVLVTLMTLGNGVFTGRHDIRHNDTQYNNIKMRHSAQ
jgi:hypothetical protein